MIKCNHNRGQQLHTKDLLKSDCSQQNQSSLHNCTRFLRMSLKLFLYSALLSTLVAQVYATSCECKEVTSWEDFRSLIVKANENGSQSPENLLLCPFHIKKIIQKDVDYWEVFAPIKKPMHISCQKQSSSDECWIEVEGDKCQFNENCGRQMIKIRSSEYHCQIHPSKMRIFHESVQ